MKVDSQDYIAIAAFFSVYGTLIFIAAASFFLFFTNNVSNTNITITSVLAITIFFGTIQFFSFYPRSLLIKKNKELERYLLYAVRHLYIKVNSGVTLFDSIIGIAYGNYGAISEEFKKAIKEIEAGSGEIAALERLSISNPSMHFRKVIWQLTNSMRAGTDISNTLRAILTGLEEHQKILIQNFGARLSPLALMYMMLTIILPSLGITFLIVFSSLFAGDLPDMIFLLIPVVLFAANIFFMNIIKSIRPNIEV